MDTEKPKQFLVRAKKAVSFCLQSLNHLLWPANCLSCRESVFEADTSLCENCWNQLINCASADYCPNCGRDVSKYALLGGVCPNCQDEKIYFDRIARCGIYDKTLREMILAFKNNRTELDSTLAFLANSALQGTDFYNDIDFFVPVPLHWYRRLVRGYNQSQLLAMELIHPSAKVSTDLVRIRYTKRQPMMVSPAKRAANVAGAFAVRYRHDFTGRRLCLVDDVKTSGATLNECAKALKEAGASKVFALVLAVAGQGV